MRFIIASPEMLEKLSRACEEASHILSRVSERSLESLIREGLNLTGLPSGLRNSAQDFIAPHCGGEIRFESQKFLHALASPSEILVEESDIPGGMFYREKVRFSVYTGAIFGNPHLLRGIVVEEAFHSCDPNDREIPSELFGYNREEFEYNLRRRIEVRAKCFAHLFLDGNEEAISDFSVALRKYIAEDYDDTLPL